MTLKNMKFKIDSPEQSAELQKVLFDMGYAWYCTDKVILFTDQSCLYAEAMGHLSISSLPMFDDACVAGYEPHDTAAFIEAHNERKAHNEDNTKEEIMSGAVSIDWQSPLSSGVYKLYTETSVETPVAIDAHYSFNYTLSQEDIDMGYIKVDPYFVSNTWKLGSKDDTGVVFHCLKNLSRYGVKNSKEREIIALYKSVKRLAQLEGVDLEGV